MNEAWMIITGAAVSGAVAVAVAWLNEGAVNRRRVRMLQQLNLCLTIRNQLKPEDSATPLIEGELEMLANQLSGVARRRPKWGSLVVYVAGLVTVILPLLALYVLLFPDAASSPWLLLALVLYAAPIYAIESQPLFLRPLVGRFAPGASPSSGS